MESEESGEEKKKKVAPRSPLRRRVLPIPAKNKTKTTASSPLDLTLKKCHVCSAAVKGADEDDDKDKEGLHLLESQWRVLLLCSRCLALMRSGSICSYCFDPVAVKEASFNCLVCLRCVHYECIPNHPYYVLHSQLDVESLACVDCSPIPRFFLPYPDR